MNPVILLVTDANTELLLGEFRRYERDYDLQVVSSADDVSELCAEVGRIGGRLAMFVVDSSLFATAHPDAPYEAILTTLADCRQAVPTSRGLVVSPFEHFLVDSEQLRSGQANGKFDGLLLMPRGVRDEEFHHAVTELLSDWGSTVLDHEVEAVRIVGDPHDMLTMSLRDLLVRTGMPHRVHAPDSEVGAEIIASYDGEPTLPLVDVLTKGVIAVSSVRELAAAFYGRPDGGGAGRLEWLDLRDTTSGEVTCRDCGGLFLLLGADPRCEWLPAALALDERGFVLTGRDVPRDAWIDDLPPESLATSIPGVFAVGDVRAGSMKRVAAASGEGSSVVPLVHAHLDGR